MKPAALALFLLASCSASAAPPGGPRVAYTVGFGAGSGAPVLGKMVGVYEHRLPDSATFSTDAKASTVRVELPLSAAFPESKPERVLESALSAGAGAHVPGDERVRALLLSSGELEFLEEASDKFLAANQTTREAERARFDAWRKEHAEMLPLAFDALAREKGGPLPDSLWRPHRSTGVYALLMRSANLRYRFSDADLDEVGYSADASGYPASSFELKKERAKDFGDWTESILGRPMAIVYGDEILMLATVKSRLPGGGIIEGGAGGFTQAEVKALVESLRHSGLPPLPLRPLSLRVEFLR